MISTQHTDVLVVGGGIAGVAAAITASEPGLTITLLERNSYLGGKATAAEVGTVCGLYAFSRSEKPEYVVHGFPQQFAETLQKRSGTVPVNNGEGLHFLPYDIAVFKEICLQYLNSCQVKVCLNTLLDQVDVSHGRIGSVRVTENEHETRYTFDSIVDCSGDAAISRMGHLEFIQSSRYQAAAQVFTLENIKEENETRLGMILIKALRSAIDNNLLPPFFDRVYIVQGSLRNNRVSIKLGIPVPVTYQEGNLEAIRSSGNDFIHQLTAFLVKNVPAFRDAGIHHIAAETGTRVGIRGVGKYILTEEDVLSCRKFEDAVATGSWPIEEWEQSKRVKMRYFNVGDHYQVPAGCLKSKQVSNLFMAGRNISATDAAIASARVMGTCLQTGYAAGKMAAGQTLGLDESRIINSIQTQQL